MVESGSFLKGNPLREGRPIAFLALFHRKNTLLEVGATASQAQQAGLAKFPPVKMAAGFVKVQALACASAEEVCTMGFCDPADRT
jgi:hypothetical protein